MKYSAQNLAKALVRIVQEDPKKYQKSIEGFVDFCRERRLSYLLPNLFKYVEIEANRQEDTKTLKIYSAIKLSENSIKEIQKFCGSESPAQIKNIEDKDIVAGFVAYFENKIIDASLKSNLQQLKNKLINA